MTSDNELGYASAAGSYWTAGWRGALPLPPERKSLPPKGWSGHDGPYPSFADIQEWIDNGFWTRSDVDPYQHFKCGNANIALRLPNTIVGIDVDFYGAKRGDLTLAHAEKLWGPLPPTVRSTSRIDGISGIRLFRIPAGVELETIIKFPDVDGRALADIETIQSFHRYVVCWPSVHGGTQRRYRWLDQDGQVLADIPRPSELPYLPPRWIDGLRRRASAEITTSGDAAAALESLPGGSMSPAVQSALSKALTTLAAGNGSRHDTIRDAQAALFRLAERGGETGVQDALTQLEKAWMSSVTRDGSRSREEARSEWDRMLKGNRIHDLIASTPTELSLTDLLGRKSTQNVGQQPPNRILTPLIDDLHLPIRKESTPEQREQARQILSSAQPSGDFDDLLFDDEWDFLDEHLEDVEIRTISFDDFLMGGDGPAIRSEPGVDHYSEFDQFLVLDETEREGTTESLTSWGLVDMAAVLAGDLKPEEPAILHRSDGELVFYKGRVNALVGESESGKSWLAFLACTEEMQAGNNILILDFEDTVENVAMRCLAMRIEGRGTDKPMLIEHLGYIAPDTMLGEAERDEFYGALDRLQPTVIVVDGVNAAMTLLGLELEKNRDCTQFFQLILKPLAQTGAAVITVDHVTKAKEGRGNYAIGAQAKRAMTDGAMIGVSVVDTFGRGRLGKIETVVLKDKPGGVRKIAEKRGERRVDYLGSLIIDARTEGVVDMRYVFESDERDEHTGLRPSEKHLVVKMMRISQKMHKADPDRKGMTETNIVSEVGGGKADCIAALDTLVRIHYVEMTETPRGARYTLVNLYHGPDLD